MYNGVLNFKLFEKTPIVIKGIMGPTGPTGLAGKSGRNIYDFSGITGPRGIDGSVGSIGPTGVFNGQTNFDLMPYSSIDQTIGTYQNHFNNLFVSTGKFGEISINPNTIIPAIYD